MVRLFIRTLDHLTARRNLAATRRALTASDCNGPSPLASFPSVHRAVTIADVVMLPDAGASAARCPHEGAIDTPRPHHKFALFYTTPNNVWGRHAIKTTV
jgi:hypothetical protein